MIKEEGLLDPVPMMERGLSLDIMPDLGLDRGLSEIKVEEIHRSVRTTVKKKKKKFVLKPKQKL